MQRRLIAVINDDPAFLEFMASFLETETDYDTVVWDDGVGVVPKLRDCNPDLVILDVRLGSQVEGMTILEEIRNDQELRTVPIVVCTADHSFLRDNGPTLAELGASVLGKPFDLEELERIVDEILESGLSRADRIEPVGS